MDEFSGSDDIREVKADLERLLGHEVTAGAAEPSDRLPPALDPNDPRLREQPPASERLVATFKWEDQAEDGEDIGPLIVFDPDAEDVVWESPDWGSRIRGASAC